MEAEVMEADVLLLPVLPFKRSQMLDKYPKGQSRGRYWKHLKQIIQAENYHTYPPDEPNYMNIETPPSMYPAKRICDVTGFEECLSNAAIDFYLPFSSSSFLAHYTDPRTKLRYADTEVFKRIRSLPNEYVQRYLALRNAAVVLK